MATGDERKEKSGRLGGDDDELEGAPSALDPVGESKAKKAKTGSSPKAASGNAPSVEEELIELLNCLASTNVESITEEISALFDTDGIVSEMLIDRRLLGKCCGERHAAVAAGLFTGLTCLVGIDFGVELLECLANYFEDEYLKESSLSLRNMTRLLSYLYLFELCSSELMLDFLNKLGVKLTEVDVDTSVVVLHYCGMKLQRDDPTGMKNYIMNVQSRVSKLADSEDAGQLIYNMERKLETISDFNSELTSEEDTDFCTRIKKWLEKIRVDRIPIRGLKWSKLIDPNKEGQWWLLVSETKKMLELAAAEAYGMNTELVFGICSPMAEGAGNVGNDRGSWSIDFWASEHLKPIKSFGRMGIMIRGSRGTIPLDLNFTGPCGIQQLALPPILSGRDVIAQAPFGAGKSTAIAIAVCQMIDQTSAKVQGIILSDSRADGVEDFRKEILDIGARKPVRVYNCNLDRTVCSDIKSIKRNGAQVVRGCPTRLLNILNRKDMDTTEIKFLILDESDFLSSAFKDYVLAVRNHLPEQLQVVLISTPLTNEILDVACNFMTNPVQILLRHDEMTFEGNEQHFVSIEREQQKLDVTLASLRGKFQLCQSIIFCKTNEKVDWLTSKLGEKEICISSLHGDTSRAEAVAVLRKFDNFDSRVFITTEVWARRLNFLLAYLVINYDLPSNSELFMHCSGRLVCRGEKRSVISLVKTDERRILLDIEHNYGIKIVGSDQKVEHFLENVKRRPKRREEGTSQKKLRT